MKPQETFYFFGSVCDVEVTYELLSVIIVGLLICADDLNSDCGGMSWNVHARPKCLCWR